MLKQHGMRIAGGQEPMKGKLIRLGHMGYYTDSDIVDLIGAWETTCRDLGWTDRSGARATVENMLSGEVAQTSEAGMALRAQSDQSAA
jgi:aspartate aminotransferase-like enzyme